MTRINAAIKPVELHTRWHIAECRELPRIPNVVRKLYQKGTLNLTNVPEQFTLGTGHVKFFYNKLLYLKHRYSELYDEGIRRGFKLQSFHSAFDDLPDFLMNDWTETPQARELLLERLRTNLNEKPHLYGNYRI